MTSVLEVCGWLDRSAIGTDIRRAKFAACGALVLWFGVRATDRSIGFFG